jgi:hypothetical protein
LIGPLHDDVRFEGEDSFDVRGEVLGPHVVGNLQHVGKHRAQDALARSSQGGVMNADEAAGGAVDGDHDRRRRHRQGDDALGGTVKRELLAPLVLDDELPARGRLGRAARGEHGEAAQGDGSLQ